MHAMIECYNFKDYRIKLKLPLNENYSLNLFEILENPNRRLIDKLVALVKHILHNYNAE